MVPMLTCGFVRSNLAFATGIPFPLSLVPVFLCVSPAGWTSVVCAELLAGCLGDDLLGHALRNLGVAVEDHRVAGPSLRLGAQVTHVAEHLRQRDESLHDAGAAALVHGLDVSTARVQVADDVAHVLLGRDD